MRLKLNEDEGMIVVYDDDGNYISCIHVPHCPTIPIEKRKIFVAEVYNTLNTKENLDGLKDKYDSRTLGYEF